MAGAGSRAEIETGADMIRTGEEYRASIRDSRAIYLLNGEKIKDVTIHPACQAAGRSQGTDIRPPA